MRRNDVASTSFRRRVPIRFLINQCQIITYLILKYDIIENSRIELRGIVLPVQMGGLFGGPKGMLAPAPPPPLSNYWGGLAPPGPPSSYAYDEWDKLALINASDLVLMVYKSFLLNGLPRQMVFSSGHAQSLCKYV